MKEYCGYIYFIMEYCDYNMVSYLDTCGRIDEKDAIGIFGQIMNGLEYLWSKSILLSDM